MPFAYAAAIGAAGSLATGLIGADASKSAANTQAQAAQRASDTELQMYRDTVAREQPFVSGGTNALANLQALLGIGPGGGGATSPILQMLGIGGAGAGTIDPSKFTGSPGYQYDVQQIMNATKNAAAARGGLGGNFFSALQSNAKGLADQNFNSYLGNATSAWNSVLGNLTNLTTLGQNAAGNLGSTGTSVANQIGANTIGAGNAQAAGTVGGANAFTGGLNGISQSALLYALNNGNPYGSGGINTNLPAANAASIALGPTNNTNVFSPSYGYGGFSPS